LGLAFPDRSRFRNLADFVRRSRIGGPVGLFLAISVLGLVIALGTHTPYYRFLVQSLGPVFKVIRAPLRGVVLFDLGLGVLATWGLSELIRGRTRARQALITGGALLVMGFEYRAFPYPVTRVDPQPSAAHRWLAGARFSGGLVEWPLGSSYDQEHEFRSTVHWKPIINGASGFAPRSYDELAAAMAKRPIPSDIWPMLAERKTTLLLFHPDQVDGDDAVAYVEALRQGIESRRIELVRSFPQDAWYEFVFRLTSAPSLDVPRLSDSELAIERARLSAVLEPPFGFVDLPAEAGEAKPESSGRGWALADSGIRSVTVAFDDGPAEAASIGVRHPGPPQVYPGYPGVETSGFTFRIPPLAAGFHTATITLTANDGGRTLLRRNFFVK
jgi:hypothetical protein